jgi:hypothetical protein
LAAIGQAESPIGVDLDPYRCYLRAELSKLCRLGDAADLLARGSCGGIHPVFSLSLESLMAALATQTQVDALLDSLDEGAIARLTGCLSAWRDNSVARELTGATTSDLFEVPLDRILLSLAEEQLHGRFEALGMRLLAIASDPLVLADPAYRDHALGKPVTLACLARRVPGIPGLYQVVDGVHRAIQAARNGDAGLLLCVYA